jgi:hypothetical protein
MNFVSESKVASETTFSSLTGQKQVKVDIFHSTRNLKVMVFEGEVLVVECTYFRNLRPGR